MSKLMKTVSQTVLLLLLPLALIAGTTLSLDRDAINSKLKDLLDQVVNSKPDTKAELALTELVMDTDELLKGVFKGSYFKKGSENTLDFKLKEFSYSAEDKAQVISKLNFDFELDFVKAYGQQNFNNVGVVVVDFLKAIIDENAGGMGDALEIEGGIDRLETDDKANLTVLDFHITVNVDLDKLPDEYPVGSVDYLGGGLKVATTPQGAKVELWIQWNPESETFDSELKHLIKDLSELDGKGWDDLKEELEDYDEELEILLDLDNTDVE